MQVKLPLAISKIVHPALKVIPISSILELNKIDFTCKNGYPKIKQDTLCKDCENGGLKTRWHYV